MAQYNHTTLLQFRSALIKALGDLEAVFWTEAELDNIIKEALLTFGALSGFWKNEILIETIDTVRMYDIFVSKDPLDTLVTPRLTYQDLLDFINRDLIETISTLAPTSILFTLQELIDLIEGKYNEYQSLTNLIVTNSDLPVVAQNNTVAIPDNILELIRLEFVHDNGNSILKRVDEQEVSYFDTLKLSEEEIPQYFSTIYGHPNNIRLYPVPSVSGILKILSINGESVAIPNVGTVINLPNNLVPYLKFGIEADIFSKDGLLNDPARASYCNQRWEEGILIGKNYYSILTVKGNGLVIDTDSISNMDNFIDSLSTDLPPQLLGLAGFNIFETDTIPNATINSIVALVNSNAPIPIVDADAIDVEKRYIEILLGYAVHLAQIKTGSHDIKLTNRYFEDFIKTSLEHNIKLQLKGITYMNLIKQSKKEEQERPKLVQQVA